MASRTFNVKNSRGRSTAASGFESSYSEALKLSEGTEAPSDFSYLKGDGNYGMIAKNEAINIDGSYAPSLKAPSMIADDVAPASSLLNNLALAARDDGFVGPPKPGASGNPDSSDFVGPPKPEGLEDKLKADQKASDLKKTRDAKVALQFLKDGIDIVNSYYKYNSIKIDNNANILQANKALMELQSDAAYAKLREQTKGKSRGDSAKMSAVARGQSSSGDNAQVASNAEDVYALQQMAMIDVNAMRQAIGLDNQIVQLETSTKMARARRNTEMAGSVASMAITGAFI